MPFFPGSRALMGLKKAKKGAAPALCTTGITVVKNEDKGMPDSGMNKQASAETLTSKGTQQT
ncbi:hypothetical protein GCM10009415_10270 [Chitinophaga japonensis]